MRTRALRPVRQERKRHILGPKLTVIATYSPLVDTRDRFGKRVGIKFKISEALILQGFRDFLFSIVPNSYHHLKNLLKLNPKILFQLLCYSSVTDISKSLRTIKPMCYRTKHSQAKHN